MITIREKQMQLSQQDRKIGLVGDHLTDYREFSMPKTYKGLDLSGYSAWLCIEPVKGDPYNQLLTKTLSDDQIILKWTITNQNVKDAGAIGVVIKLASTETGNPVWQTYKETFVVYNHVDANTEASVIAPNVFEQAVASAAAAAANATASKNAAAASASKASDYELDAYNHMLETASLSDKAVESATITSQKAAIVEAAADAETDRQNAESARVSAENIRTNNEIARITAESNRVSAEEWRVTAEQGRAAAESERVSAESARATAEQDRVTAETARQTGYAGFDSRITAVETGKVDKSTELQQADNIRTLPNNIQDEFRFNQESQQWQRTQNVSDDVTLDGSLNWKLSSTDAQKTVAWLTYDNTILPNAKAQGAISGRNADMTFSSITPSGTVGRIVIGQINDLYVVIPIANATVADIKNYFNTKPITIHYQLNTPVTTSLPSTISPNTKEIVRLSEKLNTEAWITPTLINGWTVLPEYAVGYYKDSLGIVHLRGYIISGAAGTDAFILPAGYRPAYPVLINGYTVGTSTGKIQIGTNGAVNIVQFTTQISLDGITFRAA